jgi:D-glycero-D-manno-heptose 1,7-bisphosphate phosphatase
MRAAVFLDRDGTIAEDRGPVCQWSDEWLYPFTAPALLRLQQMGYLLFVVTNQSAVARGMVTEAALRTLHDTLTKKLLATGVRLAAVRYCPHPSPAMLPPGASACACRKPAARMLTDLAAEFAVDLARSWMVGDQVTDVMAGRGAGTHSCLVMTGHGAQSLGWVLAQSGVHTARSLAEVPRLIAEKNAAPRL